MGDNVVVTPRGDDPLDSASDDLLDERFVYVKELDSDLLFYISVMVPQVNLRRLDGLVPEVVVPRCDRWGGGSFAIVPNKSIRVENIHRIFYHLFVIIFKINLYTRHNQETRGAWHWNIQKISEPTLKERIHQTKYTVQAPNPVLPLVHYKYELHCKRFFGIQTCWKKSLHSTQLLSSQQII